MYSTRSSSYTPQRPYQLLYSSVLVPAPILLRDRNRGAGGEYRKRGGEREGRGRQYTHAHIHAHKQKIDDVFQVAAFPDEPPPEVSGKGRVFVLDQMWPGLAGTHPNQY